MSSAEPAQRLPARPRLAPPTSRRVAFLCAALAIAVLPLVFTDAYWRTNLIVCALNVMLAIGLDFVLGYAGQLNLGQSAFYGIGAYVSTLLITQRGIPFWIAFMAAVAVSGFAGIVLSLFAMRLRGHYLAIASLGFAVITYQILLNWISLTQGPLGIYAIPPPPALALPGLPHDRFPQSRQSALPRRRICPAELPPARPAHPFADRRDPHRDPRRRSLGGLARDKLRGLEGVRVRRRFGSRRSGRLLLCELRRHAGAGCVLHHGILHHPGHGDRRRDGHADWACVRRNSPDRATRIPARHRRSAARGLWRRGHPRGPFHSRRHRPGGAACVRTAATRSTARRPPDDRRDRPCCGARARDRPARFCAPKACTRDSAAFMRFAISRLP